MRVVALAGALLVLLVASPVRAAVSAPPLRLTPPALIGDGESPALAPGGGEPRGALNRLHPNLLLAGLGLMATGIVAGAAGFTVLYFCEPVGSFACDDPATNVIGWVLAAPGIIPLAIGSILVYIAVNSSSRYSAAPPRALTALYVSPVPGGAMVGTSLTF